MKTRRQYEIIYLPGVPPGSGWFHRYLVIETDNYVVKMLIQNEMRRQEKSYLYIETVRPKKVPELMEQYKEHAAVQRDS